MLKEVLANYDKLLEDLEGLRKRIEGPRTHLLPHPHRPRENG
jgi:hypothetical protein